MHEGKCPSESPCVFCRLSLASPLVGLADVRTLQEILWRTHHGRVGVLMRFLTETGHRPGLQQQQRWCGQPRQGDRNVQLQEDDRALAPGRLPQHYRRLCLQRLRDVERDPPWLDAGQAEQEEGVPTGAGKGSRDSVHRTKGAHPPHGGVHRSRTETALPGRRSTQASLLHRPSSSSPAQGE